MRYIDFYRQIYKIIGNSTPIGVDCGKLCNDACCKGDDETGMYLFPGEECIYKGENGWFQICESEFTYSDAGKEKSVELFVCKKACQREKRPLSCRIFPLLPYINMYGELEVIMDPRGRGICPLVIMDLTHLDDEFVKRVKRVGQIMMKSPQMREYLWALSRLVDEYKL